MTFNFPTGGASPEAPERRRGGVLLPTIGVLAAVVVSFVLFTGFYTDWLWFTSVDKPQVYTISYISKSGAKPARQPIIEPTRIFFLFDIV